MAHLFICPNCGTRSSETDRTAGFTRQAKGCSKCGFGFLFELLDDYYPAPNAAFFVCDQEGRVIGCGRGSFELTGLDDERVIGRKANEVLGLKFADSTDHVGSTPRAICRRRPQRTSFRPMTTTAACCWCLRLRSKVTIGLT